MSSSPRWIKRASKVLVSSVLLGIAAACVDDGDVAPVPQGATAGDSISADRPDPNPYGVACTPDSISVVFSGMANDNPRLAQRFRIREYNDCQRIPVDGESLGYSPVLQIWATPQPAGLDTLDFPDGGPGYRVAIIHTYGVGSSGERGYAPLGIPEGWSCFYIRKVGTTWRGAIGECGGDRPAAGSVDVYHGDLRSARVANTIPAGYSEMPEVARWDRGIYRDSGRMVGFIGIRCGTEGWCRFGPQDAQPATTSCGEAEPWCDEQYLAVMDSTTGTLLPSKAIRGTIIPTAGLERLSVSDFACSACAGRLDTGWVSVATVTLSSDIPPVEPDPKGVYFRKMGLTASPTAGRVNRLSLRSVTRNGRVEWQARVQSANGAVDSVLVVNRHDHGPGAIVPGTARWAWSEHDEGGWTRCGNGCCTIRDIWDDI